MLELIPITQPDIDWATMLITVKHLLGRNATASLDASSLMRNDPRSFLCVLGEIFKPGAPPYDHIISPGTLANHLSFTMLLVTDASTILLLNELSDLNFTSKQTYEHAYYMSIISGTLNQWKYAILNCNDNSIDNSNRNVKLFFNKAIKIFDNLGFSQMFSEYRQVDCSDKTYKLIRDK